MDKIMSFDDYLALGNDGTKAIIGGEDATLYDGNGTTTFVNNGYLESDFGEIDPNTLVPDLNTGLGVDGKHHSYVGGTQVISDDGSAVGEQIEWPEVYLKESFDKIKLDELSINEARELEGILKRFHESVDSNLQKMLSSGWEAVDTNIKDINIGDTVFHNGHAITISKSNFKTGGFMGTTIDGDSYKNGTQPVIKLTHNRGLKK